MREGTGVIQITNGTFVNQNLQVIFSSCYSKFSEKSLSYFDRLILNAMYLLSVENSAVNYVQVDGFTKRVEKNGSFLSKIADSASTIFSK